MRGLFLCGCLLAAEVAYGSAVFEISATDLQGRDATGTITLMADTALIDLMYVGEDGATHFVDAEFLRLAESDGNPQIVLLQDFEGIVGGQVDLVGAGILSTEIEVGTQPEVFYGTIIVWNIGTGFSSATQVSDWTTSSVSVPEPAASVTFLGGFVSLMFLAAAAIRRY